MLLPPLWPPLLHLLPQDLLTAAFGASAVQSPEAVSLAASAAASAPFWHLSRHLVGPLWTESACACAPAPLWVLLLMPVAAWRLLLMRLPPLLLRAWRALLQSAVLPRLLRLALLRHRTLRWTQP